MIPIINKKVTLKLCYIKKKNSRSEIRKWRGTNIFLATKNISDFSIDYHCDTTTDILEGRFQNKLLSNMSPNSE